MANTCVFLVLTISCHILAGLNFGFQEELDDADGINEDMVDFFLESFHRIIFLDMECEPNYAGCVFVLSAIGTSFAIAEFVLLKIQFSCFADFQNETVLAVQTP